MVSYSNTRVGVIGLGYVGLPLAVEFGKIFNTVGYDINKTRVEELSNSIDRTLEVNEEEIKLAESLEFTVNPRDLKNCNFYIITVPTPIDKFNKPDLSFLLAASETVGRLLDKGDIVVYESTVYPGATEEDCVPVLEKFSKLLFNRDFYCGYSPERINPGDKTHTLTKITKIVSGSNPDITIKINSLYSKIISAGTYLAPSIKVAEAAKVIENSQRDLNIAFMNELAIILDKLDIDTREVLDAANTKWNFLPFRPGLVGGHCIGVDPYYLTYKAEHVGYIPEVILAGRKINDYMSIYVANKVIKLLVKNGYEAHGARVLVLGITFKENCPDIRNTKVINLIEELKGFGCNVDVSDYWANPIEVKETYDIELNSSPEFTDYDLIVLAVAHDNYRDILKNNVNQTIFDIRSVLDSYDGRL